jgi:hypothetical protein
MYVYNEILFSHKNGILSFVATWIETGDTVLSEISQTQKNIAFSLSNGY